VRVADADQAETALDAISAHVGTKAGAIWTVKVPIDKVAAFAVTPGIKYIQLDEPVFPNLDVARKTTKVDSVHGGYDLPMVYSGKDVVVGVIDFGFDYNHPTFYDTTYTNYRIKKVWQLNGSAAPPAGYTFGKELVGDAAIKAEGTDDPKQNHGTSVAGMAAGSGYGSTATSSLRFRGMAYESDLVMVCVRRDSIGGQWMQGGFSDFLDGVHYIFDYATSVSKPCVVNISWGSQSGSHDGTSLFNEACDAMTGPGKIVVMSAGNEGEEKIHMSKTFTATDTVINSFLTFSPATYKRTWIDIWGQPSKTFCAKATLYTAGLTAGPTTGYKCIDDAVTDMFLIGSNGIDTCFVQFITSSAEDNGKPRITVNIFNKTTDTVLVSVNGNDGSIDMWDEYYYYGFPYKFQSAFFSYGTPWATTGNNISTVSDMGSAQSVLLVGAYASKVGFTDMNGNNWSYSGYVLANRLVPFSSRGPMIDGRIKPDITAPGLTIATSMSSYDTSHTPTGSASSGVIAKYTDVTTSKDYYYCEFTGTSASSPAAPGVVALLLQANPALTPASLKTVLFETAIKDASTGALPAAGNNNWGHGKINAYGALKKILTDLSTITYTGAKPDCIVYPNPSNGNFVIDYTAKTGEPVSVAVYNIAGAMVYSKFWQVSQGNNRMSISLPEVAKGMYVVKVKSPNGAADMRVVLR
jgi:subtilisin family serine protease